MLAIYTKNLTKLYGNRVVVDNINLEIEQGKVFGFLGPNGAGKTTTMRMLLNLVKPNKGEIKILDYDIKDEYHKAAKYLSAIVETPTFFPYLNALQTLQTFSDYCRLSKSKTELESILDKCGILYASKKRVGKFSLGMKQRLGIAIALINSPKVIFLDEPANGLDPEGILTIRKLLRQLAENESRTIFISSHLLNEVEKMCDNVAILHKGKLRATGKVNELLVNKRVSLNAFPKNKALKVIAESFPDFEIEDNNSDERIYMKIGGDKIPQVIEKLVNSQIEIYEVYNKHQTLEELFHQIVEATEKDYV